MGPGRRDLPSVSIRPLLRASLRRRPGSSWNQGGHRGESSSASGCLNAKPDQQDDDDSLIPAAHMPGLYPNSTPMQRERSEIRMRVQTPGRERRALHPPRRSREGEDGCGPQCDAHSGRLCPRLSTSGLIWTFVGIIGRISESALCHDRRSAPS
jgi:hypothetical protein